MIDILKEKFQSSNFFIFLYIQVNHVDSSVQKMRSIFSNNVQKMDSLIETINICYKISENTLRNIELFRKKVFGRDIEGQNYITDLQHHLDEAQCLIDSEKEEYTQDLRHMYDSY